MTSYLHRAHQLLEINRHAEAETELRKALADNPEDANAMAMLAICKMQAKEYPQAVELAEKAVGLEPNAPFLYLVMGQANFYNKNIPKARLAISEGQRLDPANAQFYHLRANIEFYQERWEQALRETERGLELDPENVDLVNLRAQALVKLNRQTDASKTLDYALHKAPENSYSHANKGWVAIEQDRYDEAVRYFLEALRLDPENDYARNGLKEAIKAKNLFYRGMLKYFLWMDKLQEKSRWFFIIGMYVAYRVVLTTARNMPELAPFLYPLIVLYVLFAFSTWIAKPISNLFLRLHPVGKHALDKDEKLGSNVAGGLVLLSLLCFGAHFLGAGERFFMTGIVSGVLLIPIGGAFSVPPETKARRGMMIYAGVLALAGAAWVFNPAMTGALILFGIGVFVYGWVANYLISKSAKEF